MIHIFLAVLWANTSFSETPKYHTYPKHIPNCGLYLHYLHHYGYRSPYLPWNFSAKRNCHGTHVRKFTDREDWYGASECQPHGTLVHSFSEWIRISSGGITCYNGYINYPSWCIFRIMMLINHVCRLMSISESHYINYFKMSRMFRNLSCSIPFHNYYLWWTSANPIRYGFATGRRYDLFTRMDPAHFEVPSPATLLWSSIRLNARSKNNA